MQFSARVNYAIRSAVYLAMNLPGPVKCREIASVENIPKPFLDSILVDLKRAGLIGSQRGSNGGHWLVKPADAITIYDIISAVEGVVPSSEVTRPDYDEAAGASCTAAALKALQTTMEENEKRLLSSLTLAQIAQGEVPIP